MHPDMIHLGNDTSSYYFYHKYLIILNQQDYFNIVDSDKHDAKLHELLSVGFLFIYSWIHEYNDIELLESYNFKFDTYQNFFETFLCFIIAVDDDDNNKLFALDLLQQLFSYYPILKEYHYNYSSCIYPKSSLLLIILLLLYIKNISL